MKALENMTNAALLKEIEARGNRVSVAMNAVYDQFDRTDIKFNDCCARLGEDHPAVIAYRNAYNVYFDATYEATARTGESNFTMARLYLGSSPRYVRVPS
jgi:hypothetical protein